MGKKAKSEKVLSYFCDKYHKGLSGSEIARKHNISRQAVSSAIILCLEKTLKGKYKFPSQCSKCGKQFYINEMEKSIKHYDWKKYTKDELRAIKSAKSNKQLVELSKKFGRTSRGVIQKSRRLNEEN